MFAAQEIVMSANVYNPIWWYWNVERLIGSLIRGSNGFNADFSLATGTC